MTYRLPCLSFILLFVMQEAGHCVSALRQIVFQAIRIEGIDAEDDIGQPVSFLYTPIWVMLQSLRTNTLEISPIAPNSSLTLIVMRLPSSR